MKIFNPGRFWRVMRDFGFDYYDDVAELLINYCKSPEHQIIPKKNEQDWKVEK